MNIIYKVEKSIGFHIYNQNHSSSLWLLHLFTKALGFLDSTE